VTWILWRQSHIFLEVKAPIIYSYWPNSIAPCIKPIATESEYSQSKYSFFEVVHSLYSSNISIRGLLFISMEGLEKGFEEHSPKLSMKSHKR